MRLLAPLLVGVLALALAAGIAGIGLSRVTDHGSQTAAAAQIEAEHAVHVLAPRGLYVRRGPFIRKAGRSARLPPNFVYENFCELSRSTPKLDCSKLWPRPELTRPFLRER